MRRASSGTMVRSLMPVLLVAAALATAGCPDDSGDEIIEPTTTLTSVSVTGGNAVTAGQTLQLTATANFSNNTTQNVTTTATWQSSNTGVATVSTGGLATGVAPGSADIRATFQSVTGTAALQVSAVQQVNPVAQFTVSGPGPSDANLCRILVNSGGDWDCIFNGSASTGGTGGAVTQWIWRFDVGANSGGPITTTGPTLDVNPTCGFFNSRPGQAGSGFVQMIVKLQVRNAAGVLSAEATNNNVRLFPQSQCGFGF